METYHRIYGEWTETQLIVLRNFGIKPEENGYSRIDILEDDNYWQLKPYLEEWNVKEHKYSIYSKDDVRKAEFTVSVPTWLNGYPMPDGDFGFMKTTYDDSARCKSCRQGLVQKEPFRLKKAPTWGSNNMFMLNWVFDEIFVRKAFYETVLEKYNLETLPVLLFKNDNLIEDTLQLKLKESTSDLVLDNYPFEICQTCGRKRYDLITSGLFPPFEKSPPLHCFKSREDFGSGASTRRYIFLSAELRKELEAKKVKLYHIPCSSS